MTRTSRTASTWGLAYSSLARVPSSRQSDVSIVDAGNASEEKTHRGREVGEERRLVPFSTIETSIYKVSTLRLTRGSRVAC